MQRAWPGYLDELRQRRLWRVGRPLELPSSAVTVRVRDGETLVADGPFIETKEFIGGIDLIECADLDEAIEVKGRSPIVRLCPFELRPFRDDVRLGARLPGFDLNADLPGCSADKSDESGHLPHLLLAWTRGGAGISDREARAYDAWERELDARSAFVLGGLLAGRETATTLRYAAGAVQVSDGQIPETEESIVAADVVTCACREEAVQFAAGHPLAASHAIEVRAFMTGGDDAEEPPTC